MIKMSKKDIINNILGKRVEPYGFTFDGYQHRRWQLKKVTENNIEQYIVVYKSAYDNSLRLELSTSVHGGSICSTDMTEYPKYCKQFIKYSDDNGFAEIIELFSDYIIDFGLTKLDEMSVPLFLFEPDEQMYSELYANHDELAMSFAKKNNITINDTIDDIMVVIEASMTNRGCELIFDEISKRMLLEVAALLSAKVIEVHGGSWVWDSYYNTCYICNVNVKPLPWDFLKWLTFAWGESSFNRITQIIHELFN